MAGSQIQITLRDTIYSLWKDRVLSIEVEVDDRLNLLI